MADSFEDPDLAAYYDLINEFGEDDHFYIDLVMAADAVLDVGCGTGMLLKAARAGDHPGRLVGLDPAEGMLTQARRDPGVEWIRGDLGTVAFDGEFDLVVMTGHAFQIFLTDDEARAQFAAIRRALKSDGRFAFETRNPGARAWERWTPENGTDIVGHDGERVRVEHFVESVEDGLVTMTETFSSPDWPEPRVDRGTLRFVAADHLDSLLVETGFEVVERYGFWDRTPLADTSREIITIARPGPLRAGPPWEYPNR
ncbi:SAM-dependent methyltransferase [Saccharothrix ecbatanensis]|uniref:SAM-dependent methyltransferase n=1 Tax=Saccharothrix ecbatanensis TaxID=1105145 RepID=A0A7W9M293_9PSEU|nr:class I SAM-dependent methyltransferase [Saccharothrix ecbatanensis]MBB5804775.1 SAM-dependent methyltransferase [Saccharothrix ecbatanensis]